MLKHMDATAITINTLVIPGYRATIDANIYTLAVCYYNPNSSRLTSSRNGDEVAISARHTSGLDGRSVSPLDSLYSVPTRRTNIVINNLSNIERSKGLKTIL